ncbi:PIN domain-containing protein [Thermococcus sp.]
MRTLPQKISFDPFSFLKITQRQNKDILEFLLAEFEIHISLPALHSYLLAKAIKGIDISEELEELKEIFKIVETSNELLEKMAKVESVLVKESIFVDFDELITAVSAIVTNSLLVVNDEDYREYEPFIKYGLDFIGYKKFLEEIEALAEEEAKKEKIL